MERQSNRRDREKVATSSRSAIIETTGARVQSRSGRKRGECASWIMIFCPSQHDTLVDLSVLLSRSRCHRVRALLPQLHPSLTRFSNAWQWTSHARLSYPPHCARYKEATLRRAATVSRTSPRRAQPSFEFFLANTNARQAGPCNRDARRKYDSFVCTQCEISASATPRDTLAVRNLDVRVMYRCFAMSFDEWLRPR